MMSSLIGRSILFGRDNIDTRDPTSYRAGMEQQGYHTCRLQWTSLFSWEDAIKKGTFLGLVFDRRDTATGTLTFRIGELQANKAMSSTAKPSTISPSKLAHIVLRTNNIERLRDFYLQFLGATIAFEVPNTLAFLRYDEEHHRLGIIGMPDIGEKVKMANGLEVSAYPTLDSCKSSSMTERYQHFAFTFNTLPDLLTSYQQRKSLGVDPFWCVNHGPTTSIYYHDPDGNTIETQYDNLDTAGADAYVTGEAYRVNPIGVDFDPEELIQRMEAGERLETLVKRPESGPRGPEDVPE